MIKFLIKTNIIHKMKEWKVSFSSCACTVVFPFTRCTREPFYWNTVTLQTDLCSVLGTGDGLLGNRAKGLSKSDEEFI